MYTLEQKFTSSIIEREKIEINFTGEREHLQFHQRIDPYTRKSARFLFLLLAKIDPKMNVRSFILRYLHIYIYTPYIMFSR
jgi:hypothetical protein